MIFPEKMLSFSGFEPPTLDSTDYRICNTILGRLDLQLSYVGIVFFLLVGKTSEFPLNSRPDLYFIFHVIFYLFFVLFNVAFIREFSGVN